jgi:hypothetical protein
MLDAAEQLLRRAAALHTEKYVEDEIEEVRHPTVTREHGDAPEVTLRWQASDGVNRSVQILIVDNEGTGSRDGFVYQMTISAWYDDGTQGRRYWWQQMFGPPVGLDGLREQIHDAINSARRRSRADLTRDDALPDLPPGLSREQRHRLLAETAADRTRQ